MEQDREEIKRELTKYIVMDKEIVKEALREWLDEQFAVFGRWSFYGLLATVLSASVWLMFKAWH